MRGFLILCLATIATAAPQYNYNQPGVSSTFGSDSTNVASNLIGGGGSSAGHFGGSSSTQFGGGSIASAALLAAGGSGHGGSASIGFGSIGATGGSLGGTGGHAHRHTIYHKNIYIHSAPEDDLSEASSRAAESISDRKHVNIVFIKTPENRGLENAALELAKSGSEEKTAIYVLNKQTDLGELKSKVDQIQDTVVSKPQVHFVKYKTAEEAEYAQRQIQSSYDQLTGPTQVSNEGIAPVENFVGALGGQSPGVYSGGRSGHGSSYAPQQQYLPPGPSYLPS